MSETQAGAEIQVPRIYDPDAPSATVDPPPTQTEPQLLKPVRTFVVVGAHDDYPANELSVKAWLTDDLQWVQDERGRHSVLAISRSELFVGDPDRRGPVPLTVAGTVHAQGLAVGGDPARGNTSVRLRGLPRAPQSRSKLRTILIDPETGQLYLD